MAIKVCMCVNILVLSSLVVCVSAPRETSRRILSGMKAKPGQFPYIVLVTSDELQLHKPHSCCTGTILSKSWVLTAAHCFPGNRTSNITITANVTAGVVDSVRGNHAQERWSDHVIIHSKFHPVQFEYDLALIEVKEPFIITQYVHPTHVVANPRMPTGEQWQCGVIGFGLSALNIREQDLRFQRVTVTDLELCPLYTESRRDGHSVCSVIQEGRGPCKGDSGAPVVCQGVQVGTMSSIVYTAPMAMKEGETRCGVKDDTMAIEFLGFYNSWLHQHIAHLPEELTLTGSVDEEGADVRSAAGPGPLPRATAAAAAAAAAAVALLLVPLSLGNLSP